MYKIENRELLHSHKLAEYDFFPVIITSKFFIWYLKCIYVESFLSFFAGEPEDHEMILQRQ